MKNFFLIITTMIIFCSSVNAESYISWGTTVLEVQTTDFTTGVTNNGTAYSCPKQQPIVQKYNKTLSYDVWSTNITTGATTVLGSWDVSGCGVTGDGITLETGTYFDNTTGYLYAVQSNGSTNIYDILNNKTLISTVPANTWNTQYQSLSELGYSGLGVSRIVDAEGKQIISKSENGEIHIGENSLVTVETNGRQDLYATNSEGSQIDINIKSGTNLLIDGTNITSLVGGMQQDISGSVALSSALAALPNSSPDAIYTCGLGTGIHDSSSALSAGCASDFSNYAFVDNMPKIFQTASFNIGSSFLMNGEPDMSEVRDMSFKAGITFKFGSVKPTRVSDRNNYMLENKIDAVMQENRTLKAQLKEENDLIRQENDLLKAQIAEINSQLKALNMLAMN